MPWKTSDFELPVEQATAAPGEKRDLNLCVHLVLMFDEQRGYICKNCGAVADVQGFDGE